MERTRLRRVLGVVNVPKRLIICSELVNLVGRRFLTVIFRAPRDCQEGGARLCTAVEGRTRDLAAVIDVAGYLQGELGTSRNKAV
jgi:hypothetical protein